MTETTNQQKKRKPAVRRELTDFGKFCAIIRIHLGYTTEQWAKALGVSTLLVSKVERSNDKLSFDYAYKVANLVEDAAPKYIPELAAFIIKDLGVLFVPKSAKPETVHAAFATLHTQVAPEHSAE